MSEDLRPQNPHFDLLGSNIRHKYNCHLFFYFLVHSSSLKTLLQVSVWFVLMLTRNRRCCRLKLLFLLMWSTSRPGVATTISAKLWLTPPLHKDTSKFLLWSIKFTYNVILFVPWVCKILTWFQRALFALQQMIFGLWSSPPLGWCPQCMC